MPFSALKQVAKDEGVSAPAERGYLRSVWIDAIWAQRKALDISGERWFVGKMDGKELKCAPLRASSPSVACGPVGTGLHHPTLTPGC